MSTENPPGNVTEYLASLKKTASLICWMFEVLPKSKRGEFKAMFWWLGTHTALGTILPLSVAAVFHGLINEQMHFVTIGVLAFLLIDLLENVATMKKNIAREKVVTSYWAAADNLITRKILGKSLGQHIALGDKLGASNVDKGKWTLIETVYRLLFDGVPRVAELLITLCCLLFLNWVIGLILLGLLVFHFTYSLFLNQRTMQTMVPIDAETRRINRNRYERIENVERVKTTASEFVESDRLSHEMDAVMAKDLAHWTWMIRHCTIRDLPKALTLFLILCYGSYLVWHGHWEISLLYPLFSWSVNLMQTLWIISDIERQVTWAMPRVDTLKSILDLKPAVAIDAGGHQLDRTQPITVSFESVTHGYQHEHRLVMPVLRDFTLSIAPGEKVGLIGPSGAGKTTVGRLLLRYEDPQAGRICINGIDLREIDVQSWMRILGYIPQHAQIYDHTIRHNLEYGRQACRLPQLSDEELWRFMDMLHINFTGRLVDGLDTIVGKDGLQLSGGQQQRLMIGTAVAKEPLFIIIDEATSSLDPETERAVQEGLETALDNDIGALVIAHRLVTIRYLCSKFVVMRPVTNLQPEEGQIEAIGGSFEELYEISPTFRNLADLSGIRV